MDEGGVGVRMKSFRRVAFLVGLYLCSVLIVAVPAQAQILLRPFP